MIYSPSYPQEDQTVYHNAAQTPPTDVPVVYLIAQPTVKRDGKAPDLRPLAEWGDIRVLVPGGDSPTYTPLRVYDRMEDRLIHFRPDQDYIAWAGGDTLSAVFLGILLADAGVTHFRWLRYERRRLPDGTRTDEGAKYVPIDIDLRVGTHQLDLDLAGHTKDTHDD